jgi:hypothetical protein
MVDHDKSAKLLKTMAKNPHVSPQTLVACQGEYTHQAYAAYARERCASQENLTIKVGDTPSVQTGAGGVWLNVKFWVSDSSAATMQTAVLTDNSLQGADNGLQITAEVAQREPVAV